MKTSTRRIKKRIFDIIQIGNVKDIPSRAFDIFITCVIVISLTGVILSTYDELASFETLFNIIEIVTALIFTVEYGLRIWTADLLYPDKTKGRAIAAFIFSVTGIVDLVTFLPFYLPIVFPAGAVAFRVFRVIRILRLFKINSRYDAFSVIIDVINEKKKQILSSFAMVLILMVASSLCMYSLEHNAQPDVFRNAFSGIWWSVSTLLTIGYGDIYPVTLGGRIMAIVISFLGVGMVAVPTGIISAGFVESYTKINRIAFKEEERALNFISGILGPGHPWAGKTVREITFPPETVLAVVVRDEEEIVPRGDTKLLAGDMLVLGAKHFDETSDIRITEHVVKEEHDWVGVPVKQLPISRQSLIIAIKRGEHVMIPKGDTTIESGDQLVIYSKEFNKVTRL